MFLAIIVLRISYTAGHDFLFNFFEVCIFLKLWINLSSSIATTYLTAEVNETLKVPQPYRQVLAHIHIRFAYISYLQKFSLRLNLHTLSFF